MENKPLLFVTNYEKQLEIANRLKRIRKIRKISRERLSLISGVSYASIRRFETTGEISFTSFVKIMMALQFYEDLDNILNVENEYTSIDQVIKEREQFDKEKLNK